MSLATLEPLIDQYIAGSQNHPLLAGKQELLVIKYMSAEYIADTVTNKHLYASDREGFTWGDALYVTPVEYPRTTMMYGKAGVVGAFPVSGKTIFNADDPIGIDLYQQWIALQKDLYRELTTTVHANSANRQLRNDFRTRFQIDCVLFRPDEPCPDYVDVSTDWWLAITHWDLSRVVCHGFSKSIGNLKFCVIGPDSFQPEGHGYKSHIYKAISGNHSFVPGHYTSLETEIRASYASLKDVVVCGFD